MKGYAVDNGYMGYVDGDYMLFASEVDYSEYLLTQTLQTEKVDPM